MQELLKDAFEYQASNMYVCLPGIVLSVRDLGQMMVDVQPAIKIKYRDGVEEEYPTLLYVPIMFPASSTSAISFPVKAGDTVLLVFSQRGLDTFKAGSGSITSPVDFRKFDKRDAIAIPGLFPFSKSVNDPAKHTLTHNVQDFVVVHNIGTANESELRITESGNVKITAKNELKLKANSLVVEASTMTVTVPSLTMTVTNTAWTGNGTVLGVWTFNGKSPDLHIHGGVTTGASSTLPPT